MSKGVIEFRMTRGDWSRSCYGPDLDGFVHDALLGAENFTLSYRYREGNRAVMLWPESRMGEVVEL